VFVSVEVAVDQLFAAASKAKRSKIRSFAAIHEALGDLLNFPTHLSERSGLQLATALRSAGPEPFRKSLVQQEPVSMAEEQRVLDRTVASLDARKDPARGGRPSQKSNVRQMEPLALVSGGTLSASLSDTGLTLHLTGQQITPIEAREIMERVRNLANRP